MSPNTLPRDGRSIGSHEQIAVGHGGSDLRSVYQADRFSVHLERDLGLELEDCPERVVVELSRDSDYAARVDVVGEYERWTFGVDEFGRAVQKFGLERPAWVAAVVRAAGAREVAE